MRLSARVSLEHHTGRTVGNPESGAVSRSWHNIAIALIDLGGHVLKSPLRLLACYREQQFGLLNEIRMESSGGCGLQKLFH